MRLAAVGVCLCAACGDPLRLPDGGTTGDAATVDARTPPDGSAGADAPTALDAGPDAAPVDGGGVDGGSGDASSGDAGTGIIVDYQIAPRGARLVVSGAPLAGTTSVTLGGVAQDYAIDSSDQLTIAAVAPATPLGPDQLVVTTPSGPLSPATVEVVDLGLAPQVAAHGGTPTVVLTGLVTGFDGTATVTLGGVAQPVTVTTTTALTIGPILDATPTGAIAIAITTQGVPVAPLTVAVIHLVIGEADPDQAGFDTHEYVEIATGQAGVSLAGYALVFFTGTTDTAYYSLDLSGAGAVTDGSGLLLAGNGSIGVPESLTWANDLLGASGNAIAIYQGDAASFPTGTSATTTGLIDALVHGTGDPDDVGLLAALLGAPSPAAVQVDENVHGAQATESISRCDPARLDGRVFSVGERTPGSANTCP